MRRVVLQGVGPGFLLSLSACAIVSQSQPQTVVTQNPQVRAYVQGMKGEAHLVDLVIRKLDIDVAIRGGIAEAEMEFDVAAPASTAAPVEGRLHVDLPPGSIVSGYALDVNGGLVDGSLVDQSKARSAYERQVRRQMDPGYTEIDQTGGFNTRIFPIDAEKGRRIRLRFVTPIADEFALPLRLIGKDGQLSIRVVQAGARNPPEANMDGVSIRRRTGHAVGHAVGPIDGTLRIPARQPRTVASRHSSGEEYWQLAGVLPEAAAAEGGSLRIYWDRSRSRRDHDHDAELARVREAVAALKPASIEWVTFSSGAPERAVISSDAELRRRVASVRYGGATSFSVLANETTAANCLLVSDGRPTFGPSAPPKLPCRVFAIAPAAANLAVLQHIADSTGGRVIAHPTKAADWLNPAVQSVATEDGHPIPFVSLLAPSGYWRVMIPAPKAGPVRVTVGGEQLIEYGESSPIAFNGEAELFAGARLALLEDPANRSEFVEISRRYSVASPTLSFVVLERPEDYVQHDVTPPANYTRQEEWAQLAAEAAEDMEEAKADRFAELLKDWNEQVAWWEKTFDLTAKPQRRESKPAWSASAPSPPSPTPSPPPPAAERDDSDDGNVLPQSFETPVPTVSSQEIVLTGSRLSRGSDLSIAVSAWRPQSDYIDAYDADAEAFYAMFAEWDRKAGDVPSFYLDTADWLARKGRKELALETLLSALDLPTANEVTLGMVAGRLERYGAIEGAIALRERQALLDAAHPQPRRLLALALARRAELGTPTARDDLERAIRLLTEIALAPLDERWTGIDIISLIEANALLVQLNALGGSFDLDPRLTKNLDSDVRVVLDWSSDAADIDLWIDEPSGERAIYNHARTLIGGHLSNDMTSGFGPEQYLLRRAAPGRYTVRANVFSPDRLDPNGASRVTAHLFRDWGRSTQREESIDLDLRRGQKGEVRIGTLKVGTGAK